MRFSSGSLLCLVVMAASMMACCASAYPLNVTEIIRGYGYPCEQYTVLTDDGYLLSVQRIPYGRTSNRGKGVVFYQHGFMDSSTGIVLSPPNEGLPFILADLGYDVWMGNNRGNGLSMAHVKYNINQPQFWDFSWDEMATYDLPAHINFVLKATGKKTLSYIGHSEGTTQAFAGFEDAALAAKVDVFIALAPVARIFNIRVALMRWLVELDAEAIFGLFGVYEFTLSEALHKWLPNICRISPAVCEDTLDFLMGPSVNVNASRMAYIMNYEPFSSSVQNIVHWAQGVGKDTFSHYDYGQAGNMLHYNQTTAPLWNVGDIPKSLPIALFTGTNDYLADTRDVEWLVQNLPAPPVFQMNFPTYAHCDFLWADDAFKICYPHIVDLLEKYN